METVCFTSGMDTSYITMPCIIARSPKCLVYVLCLYRHCTEVHNCICDNNNSKRFKLYDLSSLLLNTAVIISNCYYICDCVIRIFCCYNYSKINYVGERMELWGKPNEPSIQH